MRGKARLRQGTSVSWSTVPYPVNLSFAGRCGIFVLALVQPCWGAGVVSPPESDLTFCREQVVPGAVLMSNVGLSRLRQMSRTGEPGSSAPPIPLTTCGLEQVTFLHCLGFAY